MPSTATDRIDSLSTSVAVKAPCRFATTANISLTGLAVQGGGEWASPLTADDRIFVWHQTNSLDNGIWVAAGGTWARAKDFDGARDAVQGTLISVYRAAGLSPLYRLTTANPVRFGTSEITFEEIDIDADVVRAELADTDDLANGDDMIGVKRTLTNAIATTLHDWIELTIVNVKSDFGAMGDGVTVDTTAFNRARISLQSTGGTLYIPAGTYLIDDDVALAYHSGNVLIRGAGRGATILKMANNSAMPTFVGYTGTGYFRIQDLTIDGNRANNGISTSGYCLYFSGKHCAAFNNEITGSNFAGVFVGNIAGDPNMYEICFNHIHDNGGIVSGGDGVGIFGGGSDAVYDLKIIGNRITDNYCIDTLPGDSTGINVTATSVYCVNNYFLNNYNVNGGQLAIASDVTDGATDGQIIVCNNIVEQTDTFGGDLTCGIELLASNYIVSGNILKNIKVDGLRMEGSASRGIISDNAVTCQTGSGGACINLIASGGTGMGKTSIHDNLLLAADIGVSMQPGTGNVFLHDNYIDSAIASPIVSADNFKVIRANDGYSPTNQTVSAGGSPWTSDIKNFDCQVMLTTPNGISALTLGGVNLTITANTNFFLKARKQFVATWSGSAPVFNFIAQQ
jgi:hypothetical protein